MRLIWIRHGETELNREGRYCGHLDVPLNENGRRQAASVAERLAAHPIRHVYVSDLLRSRQTAEPLLTRLAEARVEPTPLLRELSFGDWEGWTYEEIRARFPTALHRWLSDPVRVPPPAGETLGQMEERLGRWLEEVLHRHREGGEWVAAVSHGGPIRWFFSRHIKGDPDAFWERRLPHGVLLSAEWNGTTWREVPLRAEEREGGNS
ncbi:alpha-ribazole phosphatase [Melghirimyces profundicolus]|uniref:Alpha-ribazole phosphatase n=1 Tax=Melghirimyces profundicolus TaxID=1242148 RepID=A0A2T6C7L4_9BACL|nr:histidine phosphatase family protein [Melghirimyces profundicolus]PTX64307.1 alpha-ribazole phosphatase [Melghirimyces profundicolus]